jgi:hypothetical protein
VELQRTRMQSALRVGRSAALAQVVQPCRTMKSLCPKFGIGDIARQGPTVGAVALTAELYLLHDGVETSRPRSFDPIFDLDDDWTAPGRQGKAHLRIGKRVQRLHVGAAHLRHA